MTFLLLVLVGTLPAAGGLPVTDLPTGEGLPVRVNAAVHFVDVIALDENAKTFTATVDVRLRWKDGRMAYPASEAPTGFKEVRDDAAAALRAEAWVPDISVANQVGEAANEHVGLRWYPDGRIEMMRRFRGSFAIALDATKFPFDGQDLVVDLASLKEPAGRVSLVFDQNDLTLSRVGKHETLDGWTIGKVDVRRAVENGWYGTVHSHVRAALRVVRDPAGTIGPIFIPLLASLLIPFIALWLNEAVGDGFKVGAFELANVLIGGLFALIALNFTVYSSYTSLSGDNTISRLFTVNYILLGAGLVVDLCLFRYNAIRRLFGMHVHLEVFSVMTWSFPALAIVAVAWILAMAAA